MLLYKLLTLSEKKIYESILLICNFLYFLVEKVLVANEKNRRNYSYLTDNVNIFVENIPDTTEKNSRMRFSFLYIIVAFRSLAF